MAARMSVIDPQVPPSKLALLFAAVLFLAAPSAWAGTAAERRVESATKLVEQLDLANTDYEHGPGSVTWTGTVASHTDCSGFVDQLLMHDDGYAAADFKAWLGSRRPTAERYHDAIAAGRGFQRIASMAEVQAGDFIAIKYLTRHYNTGHIMLVIAAPRRIAPVAPLVEADRQWLVDVIDSSESGHGPTDTRHKRGAGGRDHDGLGRGVFRVYTNERGEPQGFAWSALKSSRFISPDDEHLVLGRLVPGFRP